MEYKGNHRDIKFVNTKRKRISARIQLLCNRTVLRISISNKNEKNKSIHQ